MKAFNNYRSDLDKILAKNIAATCEDEAFGKYVSALMAAGLVVGTDDDRNTKQVFGNSYRVKMSTGNEFVVEVRTV
ncbi:MAG: hypothetical protein FWF31_11380 [Desulfobulbus sp.]|nr:hypothetical protein [Desulfobulbus sp.]